jgi:hypothetical protein
MFPELRPVSPGPPVIALTLPESRFLSSLPWLPAPLDPFLLVIVYKALPSSINEALEGLPLLEVMC